MTRAIALVDCNNFYVACERLFQPKLEGVPVVVLSNNDGCVVSRSQEVKDLGVKMAEPWFKLKDIAKRHGIVACSSNYTLYADLSNRVMSLLAQFSPEQEVYSIDESFLDLTEIPGNHIELGQKMRETIKRCTGIPVCVGIASSKTLAKLANHIAKKNHRFAGVCDLNQMPTNEIDSLFSTIEVGEVWGIGRKTTARLASMNIHTVQDLKTASPQHIRDQFSVVVERTVNELNGIACLELEDVTPDKQQIICSRSFGMPVTNLLELEQSVVAYTTRACEKLRRQSSLAGGIHVYIQTNSFKEKDPQYQQGLLMPLAEPTDDTRVLCGVALRGLHKIFRPGFSFKKTGVMLTEITPATERPRTLFDDVESQEKASKLMKTLDRINSRMGSGTVGLAGEGTRKRWAMKRDNLSSRATTEWAELIIAH